MFRYVHDLAPYKISNAELQWFINYHHKTERQVQISCRYCVV